MACDSDPAGPEARVEPLEAREPAQLNMRADPAVLSEQLNAVRRATRTYRDIEEAKKDGYGILSPFVPGMGFHYGKAPPFGTDRLSPGVLVYAPNGSYNPSPGEELDPERTDDLILVAVEYLVDGDQTGSPPDIFDDELTSRRLKVTEEHGWHYESDLDFTGLHAWVHRGNPAGVFHPTNPNVE